MVANGALNLRRLTESSSELRGIREAYAEAIQSLIIYSLVAVCVALPFALGMEWLNVHKAGMRTQTTDVADEGKDSSSGVEMQARRG